MTAEERSRVTLDGLVAKVHEHRDRLGKAVLQFAMSREGTDLKPCIVVVNFLSKSDPVVEEIHYDYGRFCVVKKVGESDDVLSILNGLRNGTLEVPELGKVSAKEGTWREVMRIPSGLNYGPVITEWPTWYSEYELARNMGGRIPDDDLTELNLPLYPDGKTAVKRLFNLRPEFDRWRDPLILFLIPDYRARIDTVRIADNIISAKIETQEISEKELIAKFYCESHAGANQSENIQVEDGMAKFHAIAEPFYVNVHLLSSSTGEDLDSCDFDLRRQRRQEKVILERAQYQMEELIRQGESQELEFKANLKEPSRFLRTVVAFANSSGGRILLGVDDDSQIVGYGQDEADRITNLISSNCSPPIEVRISRIQLVKPILMVEIPEGTNKPYEYRERGFYMRRGATNMLMTRSEIDEIYARRQSR
jgi:hypothetical protein